MIEQGTCFKIIGRGVIVTMVVVLGCYVAKAAHASVSSDSRDVGGTLRERTSHNLIAEPAYTKSTDKADEEKDDEDGIVSEEKLQYEPVDDEEPPLKLKKSSPALVKGAHYDEGEEIYIAPSSEYQPTRKVIEDIGSPAPSVETTPAPYQVQTQ